MAELPKLPSQTTLLAKPSSGGSGVTNVRSIDRVGIRAAGKYADTVADVNVKVANMLDPLVDTAVKESAYKYAAENPITLDQLTVGKDGTYNIKNVNALKGNPLSKRSQIIRKLQSKELSTRLLRFAERQLLAFLPDIKSGKLSGEEALLKINSVVDGISGTMNELDAETATQFRANVATLGNDLYKQALSIQIERQAAEDKIESQDAFAAFKLKITNFLANPDNYPVVNEEGKAQIHLGTRLDAEFQTFKDMMLVFNPANFTVAVENARKFVNEAKINAVVDHISSAKFKAENNIIADYQVLTKLEANSIGALSQVYFGLSPNDKREVQKLYLEKTAQQFEAFDKDAKRAAEALAPQIENYVIQWNSSSVEERQVLQTEMLSLTNPVTGASIFSAAQLQNFSQDLGVNEVQFANLVERINNNAFASITDLNNFLLENDTAIPLNGKQRQELFKLQQSASTRQEKRLENLILQIASDPIMSLVGGMSGLNKNKQKEAERVLENILTTEQSVLGEKFNRLKSLQDIYKTLYNIDGTLKKEDEISSETVYIEKLHSALQAMSLQDFGNSINTQNP